MASNIPRRAFELQNELFDYICIEVYLSEVDRFKWLFHQVPLSTDRCKALKTTRDLLIALMEDGAIALGMYSILLPRLEFINKTDIVRCVLEKSEEIKKVLDEAGIPLGESDTTIKPEDTSPNEAGLKSDESETSVKTVYSSPTEAGIRSDESETFVKTVYSSPNEAGLKSDESETSVKTVYSSPTEAMNAANVTVAHEKKTNYKEIMKEEAETQNINLTFIGQARAGKTCLMRQLLRKSIKIGGPDRTNLAELLTKRLRYKLGKSAKERERLEKGKEAELCRLRLRRLRKRREDAKMTLIYQRNDPSGTGDMGPTENETDTFDSSEESEEESPPFMGEMNTSQMADDQIKAIEDIHKEEKSIDDSSVAYVTLFDFGGDNVFRNCQHCIMSANSIYLLVFDVSLFGNGSEREQDNVIDEIVFWLNLVATYAKAKDESTQGKPPIILIGSHMDKVTDKVTKNENVLSDEIWAKLKEKPGMEAILEHHVRELLFFADMNVSDLNEEKYLGVWCEIEKCVHIPSCWHYIITGCWLALEEKLMLEKEKGIKFLNIKQILDINEKLLVPLEEDELVPFLQYLHNAGSMFCFGISGKQDSQSLTEQEKEQMNVILDINWIVQAFGAIITDDDFVKTTGHKQRLMWNGYKETANLTDIVLDFRWNNVSNEYRQVLLSEMKNLGLITEPGNVSDSPSQGKENQSYIVPCLLGEAKPDCIQELLNNSNVYCTKTLCLVFEHQFVPQAVWDKTVAFCIHAFGECTNLNTSTERAKTDYLCPKRGLICRSFNDVWNFVMHCKGTMLKLTMFTHHKPSLTHEVGQNLRLKIEDILKTTLSKANQGHRIFSHYIHCDFFISDGELHGGKPNEETWNSCNEYRVEDARGNERILTRNDWQTWFGVVDKVSPVEKFTDMIKVKEIHADMVTGLHCWIYPTSTNRWETFQTQLEPFLADAELYDVPDNSMAKICKTLMSKKVIDYGEYSTLREIVNRIHVKAAGVIDKAMVDLLNYWP